MDKETDDDDFFCFAKFSDFISLSCSFVDVERPTGVEVVAMKLLLLNLLQ